LSPCHEEKWGSRIIASPFSASVVDGGKWSVSRPGLFTAEEKTPFFPLDTRLGGPQSRSVRYAEGEKLALLGIEPQPSST
jgi:hypothetical protein